MRRKLWAAAPAVKRAALPVLVAFLGWLGPSAACGGGAPPPRRPDPYGPRIANCVDAPRPRNDAAQERMLHVPGGLAVLGSTAQERAQARLDYGKGGERLFEDETKVRRAYVHDFRMDKSPVTPRLFAEFVEACGVLPPDAESLPEAKWRALAKRFGLPWDYARVTAELWFEQKPPPTRELHPMVLVTQEEAGFYCAWRGSELPTEDEWERAARGATGNVYPWGDRYDPFRVNTAQTGTGDTMDVGSMPHGDTAEGFTDMGGMVFEWTQTPWPGKPGFAVVKGNAFNGRGGYGRGAARVARPVELRDLTLGFRCAHGS